MVEAERTSPGGVLAVDKPPGPTSHDIVARARRAFGTRAVGHAGTLDPMATGVLVLAVGEGTKLLGYITADDKEYLAEIALGTATGTLDADGEVVRRAPLPLELDVARVRRAVAAFIGVTLQRAPEVSALKVDGRRLHDRVRRGERVEAPVREVVAHEIEVLGASPASISLRVVCGKGFYVRALARDLAESLGTVGHLSALRRTRSGAFPVAEAVESALLDAAARGDTAARRALDDALMGLVAAWQGPVLELNAAGVTDAWHGRPVRAEGVARGGLPETSEEETLALVGPDGELVALARRREDALRVVRGFRA